MAVTVDSFRRRYPEFANGAVYPNSAVDYYLLLSAKLIANPDRWGDLEDDAKMLFIAHHVALERKAMEEAQAGSVPGAQGGVINQMSVDKVSVGFDSAAGTEKDAGHWNLTVYGIRLKGLMNMVGAGPISVGAPCPADYGRGAWPGPIH